MIITLAKANFSGTNINDLMGVPTVITVNYIKNTDNSSAGTQTIIKHGTTWTLNFTNGNGLSIPNGWEFVSVEPTSLSYEEGKTEAAVHCTVKVKENSAPVTPTNYTFTINPNPTSATVTLSATGYSTVSGTGSQSITVANGTEVSWSVEADGYTTRTGNWTINSGNKTESIVLIAAGGSGERVVIAEKADYSIAGFCRPTNGSFGGTTDTSYKRTDYIDITAYSTLYAYCQPRATSVSPISFFDAEKVWIKGITPDNATVTEQQEFTADVPANAVYAIFSGFSNSNPLKAEGILK